MQIFKNCTIVSINVNANSVLGLSSTGQLYLLKITVNNNISTITSATISRAVLLANNVRSFSSNEDYVVYLTTNGTINYANTLGTIPSNIASAITSYTLSNQGQSCITDVKIYNDSVIVCYV
jgi:hypothetical protein